MQGEGRNQSQNEWQRKEWDFFYRGLASLVVTGRNERETGAKRAVIDFE